MAISPSNPFDQFDTAANPFDQFDSHTAMPVASSKASAPELYSSQDALKNWLLARGADVGRSVGLAGRTMLNGVMGLPLMAANAGVATRNLLTGSNYELPTQSFNRALTESGVPQPIGFMEKAGDFIGQMLTASMTPSVQPTSELLQTTNNAYVVPANYQNSATALKQAAVQKAQDAGYVIPPSSGNPSLKNTILEGIGGKLKTQQEASVANQPITNSLAARALGQNENAPLTQGSLSAIRSEAAAKGYEPIRNLGEIPADDAFRNSLQQLVSQYQGAARIDPRLGNPQVAQIAEALDKPSFNSADVVDAIRTLRGNADDAFGSGNAQLGRAYKSAAGSLEDLIDRHLTAQGENGSALLNSYRDARALIAKTFSVGKALNEETGNVSAQKLGRQLAAGKPLSDELRSIAGFASAFPKAARETAESFPAISPLDAYGSAMAAASSGSGAPLLLPLTRVGIRSYLLSSAGQAGAVPSTGKGVSPQVLNSFFGLPAPLFGQQSVNNSIAK